MSAAAPSPARVGKALSLVGKLLVRREELIEYLGEKRYREEVDIAMRATRNDRTTAATLLFAALVSVLGLCGCSLFPDRSPEKIATSVNARDFYMDRYDRACVAVKGPAWCAEAQRLLNEWKADHALAAKALKNGGKLPLQLRAIKADEKKVKAVLK